MSNDVQTVTLPQINRGIVLKKEIGSLQPGEYSELLNATSVQEGSIQARLGSERFPNGISMQPIHSLAKLSLGNGDASDPRYAGEDNNIWRITGPYSTYTLVTSGLGLAANARWEAATYNAGASGTANFFFAHPTKLLRDTGAYTPLRRWGIPAPIAPVVCGLANPLTTTLTTQAGGSDQLSGQTVSTATVINGSYYQIVPTSLAGILQGMLVQIGSQFVVVDAVDSTSFYAYCTTVPSGTIHAWYNPVATPGSPQADGTTYYQDFSGSVNWAFGGSPSNGYSTSDNVNVELYVSNWTYVSEIRVRVYVNGSSSDYYEQAISPPATLTYNAQQATAAATQLAAEQEILAISVYKTELEGFETPNITPINAPSQVAPQWVEYPLSKANFQNVGNAGSGQYNWSNVTDVRIVVITVSVAGTPSLTVNVGAIYAIGGQGPDSVTVSTAQPYSYAYTYRDPLTGNEGNPCTYQIPTAFVSVQNRAVQVTCWGTDTSAAGDPTLAGPNTISVYRSGGTFADAFYRFVGYATNPGVSGGSPQKVVFVDNQPDFAIAGNALLETDNFMPIPSSMPIPFTATIATITQLTGNFFTVTFANLPGGATNLQLFLLPGSQLTLGIGSDNQEIAYVQAVPNTGEIFIYLQYTHIVGEQCSAEAFPYGACDVICQSGDAILLAGDPNNPHQVYRSKSGEPTSFPVINNETGNAHIQIVGSPSNPINGLVEFNGEIVCLNLAKIYTFSIWYGAMSTPVDSGASRGMVGKHLWALVDGAIWYLSYDGVYAWAGGQSVSMTEQIRSVFDQTGIIINGYNPLDYTQLANVHVAYYSKYFYIQYVDTTGNYQVLRCSILDNHRWERFQYTGSLTAMFTEKDTGRLIAGVYDNSAGKAFITQLEMGSTDAWESGPTTGSPIGWNFITGFYPPDNRDVQKLFTDIVIELENPNDNVELGMFYDYSTNFDPTDQFTIPAFGPGRHFIEFPLQQSGSPATSLGKFARVAAIEMLGSATNTVKIYSIQFKYKVMAPIHRGRIEDWQDLGHPWDKRLYACTIEYDTGGVSQTVILDTKSGINGNTENDGVQSFVLDGNRSKQEFPIIDGQIAKLVRLRPQVATADMKIFDVQWKKEDYPADIVLFTEYDDCGSPYAKYLQQVILDVDTNGVNVTVEVQGDGPNIEAITVNGTQLSRLVIITMNTPLVAKKFRLLVSTPLATNGKFQLYSCKYITVPADKGPVSHTGDWMDFGTPNDKHLKVIVVEYENAAGLVLQLDSLSGVGVTTEHDSVATFTLNGTSAGATARIKQQFAIPDSVVAAKAFRLRPVPTNVPTNFKLWGWDAPEKEVYPADAINWTEWKDFGYPHAKYAQQLILDVDTGGVAASVQVMNEAGVAQTLSVTSTFSTREQILTLSPQLLGFKYRLLVTPGSSKKFQMWDWRIGFLPADKGPVTHSFDWDEIGHPYSKRLLDVTLEYDNSGGTTVMLMDILGADGVTITTAAFSFQLGGTGRSKQTYPFPIDTFATMIRFYPSTTTVTLKEWKYVFSKEDQPANVIPGTDWTNEGYACEKILRGIELDLDSGGLPCSVVLQVDGTNRQTFSVTTTSTDRVRILSPNSNIIGKLFRLVFSPTNGGKAQFYGVTYQTIKEPCARSQWDSYEQNYGIAGWKLIKQIWCEYISAVPVVFSIYRDTDQLFYQTTLPAHSHRDVERFFLPASNTGLTGSPLNKSKIYRVTIDASDNVTPFKFYRDSSRIEVKELSNDQRACYQQKVIWEEMPIPA